MKNDGKKVSRKRKKHFGFEMLDLIEFELYIMRFNDKLLRGKTLWKKKFAELSKFVVVQVTRAKRVDGLQIYFL